MDSKQKVAIILAVIGLLGGGGAFIAIDMSTNIQTNTINTIANNLNIDIDDLRALCDSVDVPPEYQPACNLLKTFP